MQFYLDNMIRDNVIFSVYQFFEQLFRMCQDKDSMVQISNALVFEKAKQISKEKVLERLPLGMGQIFTQEKCFCVRNMEK